MLPPVNTDGEWNEYAKLVLTELERHNRLLTKMDEKLDAIKIEQAIYEREISGLKGEIIDVKSVMSAHNNRISKLEHTSSDGEAVGRYKKYLVGGLIGFLTAILIPAADILVRVLLASGKS